MVKQPPANGSALNGDHTTLDTTIPPLGATQTVVPEPAEIPLGGVQTTTEIVNVDSPEILEVPSLPQQSTEGQDRPQVEEQAPLVTTSTEGHVATQYEDPPIIEDISATQFLTDTQRSPDQVDQPSPQIEHKAASSREALFDVCSTTNEQLQILLEQALAETQNRWVRSQNQVWHIETSVERAWKQCREAVEPVFGPVPDEPSSRWVDEMASLCTRLASEVEKWKTQCSRDSTQEATILLANSFAELRSAEDRLKEVEPALAAHKAVLDNWPTYCDQTYEQE